VHHGVYVIHAKVLISTQEHDLISITRRVDICGCCILLIAWCLLNFLASSLSTSGSDSASLGCADLMGTQGLAEMVFLVSLLLET
jgi:hypothetical protein